MQSVILYCDGSTINNGKFGQQKSWICVVDEQGEKLFHEEVGDKTIIEAEGLAILKALEYCIQEKHSLPLIITDNQFWQRAILYRWKLQVARLWPLRDKLYDHVDMLNATIRWTSRNNNLAGKYIERLQKEERIQADPNAPHIPAPWNKIPNERIDKVLDYIQPLLKTKSDKKFYEIAHHIREILAGI